MTTALVVGLGNPDRGDDAVGAEVARAVADRGLPRVQVVEHEDPTGLLDVWAGHDPVVVVDAVRSGGTHAFGLGAAVELARALHRLPDRLVVIGVEADTFEYGAPLSGPVAAAVQPAADRVLAVLAEVSAHVPR